MYHEVLKMDFKPWKRCQGPTRCGAAGVDDNAPPESCDVIVELRDMRMMRRMMSPSYCGEQGTRGTRRLCRDVFKHRAATWMYLCVCFVFLFSHTVFILHGSVLCKRWDSSSPLLLPLTSPPSYLYPPPRPSVPVMTSSRIIPGGRWVCRTKCHVMTSTKHK